MSRFAEVYAASYRIDAQFSGLRYLMFHYPMTAAFFGTGLNMFILVSILILSWYRFFANPVNTTEEEEEYKDPFGVDSGSNSNSLTGELDKDDLAEDQSESDHDNLLGENVEKVKKESETDEDIDTLPDVASSKELFGL